MEQDKISQGCDKNAARKFRDLINVYSCCKIFGRAMHHALKKSSCSISDRNKISIRWVSTMKA